MTFGGGVLLFGGTDYPNTGEPPTASAFHDTWEWDGQSWTQVADKGPAGRIFHTLANDTCRGRVVLFGGATDPSNSNGIRLGDTWELVDLDSSGS